MKKMNKLRKRLWASPETKNILISSINSETFCLIEVGLPEFVGFDSFNIKINRDEFGE